MIWIRRSGSTTRAHWCSLIIWKTSTRPTVVRMSLTGSRACYGKTCGLPFLRSIRRNGRRRSSTRMPGSNIWPRWWRKETRVIFPCCRGQKRSSGSGGSITASGISTPNTMPGMPCRMSSLSVDTRRQISQWSHMRMSMQLSSTVPIWCRAGRPETQKRRCLVHSIT